jgi:release factor glutamine methyltransferase
VVSAEDRPSAFDVGGAIPRVQKLLARAGIAEAPLEAEVLVRHVLGADRAALLAHPEQRLSPEQRARLEALLARRQRREPLAYILGFREFYGLAFHVTPAVLVPRQETETLVDEALRWARAPEGAGRPLTISDVGTGSGCIAVSLAVHLPAATVIATDTSPAALEVARENARRHGVEARIAFLLGALLEPVREAVGLIVANLPYIPDGEMAGLQPEVRDYEPREALAGGPDGTALLRALLVQAPPKLRPGGALMLEIDPRLRAALVAAAQRCFPQAPVRVVQDLAGRDRVLVISSP